MREADGDRARLFANVIVPLVLGGSLRLERPYGARAWRLARETAPGSPHEETDQEVRLHDARLKAARRLAPLDRVAPLGPAEWALSATLHDLLQMLHPRLEGRASRLLASTESTLSRIPEAATVADAIGRHTLFARVLSITRTDTTVRFWAGRHTYVGAEPPARAVAWPRVRRVEARADDRLLFELSEGSPRIAKPFTRGLAQFLAASPLTFLATASRAGPPFEWNAAALRLVATPTGARLATRAVAQSPDERRTASAAVAVGLATRSLADERDATDGALATALAFLGDLALDRAGSRLTGSPGPFARGARGDFALAMGAAVASARLAQERALYTASAFDRLAANLAAETTASAEAAKWAASRLERLVGYFLGGTAKAATSGEGSR